LRYLEVSLEGKNKTLVKILGVVNTGRPLQFKYRGVAIPATPAALTPMVKELNTATLFDGRLTGHQKSFENSKIYIETGRMKNNEAIIKTYYLI